VEKAPGAFGREYIEMSLLPGINAGLSFLLELSMLASLGYWGFKTGESWVVKAFLGLGAPALAAVLWGIYCAPKAAKRLQGWSLAGLEIVLLSTGAAALYFSGQAQLAWIYTLLLVINRILWIAWKQ
jgi:hypothetical protein